MNDPTRRFYTNIDTNIVLATIILLAPILNFIVNLVSWTAYGIDIPFMDDWRAYQTGQAGSFALDYLFHPANDTLSPVGLFFDSLAHQWLGGNSIAYQLITLSLVLGSLLFLQWRLLRYVLPDLLLAACAFSATLFMLQPDSYWGLQNLAYHQAVPLVAILFSLYLILVAPWHRWLSPLALVVIGAVSGMIYISGAFAMLAAGGVLLLVAWVLRPSAIARRLISGGSYITLVGMATAIPQLWVIVAFQKGTHRPDAPMAYPTDPDFWLYLLGKVGRSLMAPVDHPAISLLIVSFAVITLCVALFWAGRHSWRDSDPGEQGDLITANYILRAFIITLTLTAVVFAYLLMVAAGRTNLRPDSYVDALSIFTFAFARFHYFWVTLLWPWLFAIVLLACRRHTSSLFTRGFGVALAAAIIYFCAGAGAYSHPDFYRSASALRIAGIQCIHDKIEESKPIICDTLLPVGLGEALSYADQSEATFTRTLGISKVEILPIDPYSQTPLQLGDGDSVGGHLKSPASGSVDEMGIFVGNYGGASDGELSAELCSTTGCVRDSRSVKYSKDNDFLWFIFDDPLQLNIGDTVTFKLTAAKSSHPLAAWLYPSIADSVVISDVQHASGHVGPLPDQTLQLALHYQAIR